MCFFALSKRKKLKSYVSARWQHMCLLLKLLKNMRNPYKLFIENHSKHLKRRDVWTYLFLGSTHIQNLFSIHLAQLRLLSYIWITRISYLCVCLFFGVCECISKDTGISWSSNKFFCITCTFIYFYTCTNTIKT